MHISLYHEPSDRWHTLENANRVKLFIDRNTMNTKYNLNLLVLLYGFEKEYAKRVVAKD